MNKKGEVPPNWRVVDHGFQGSIPLNQETSFLVHTGRYFELNNTSNACGKNVQQISPTMAINFDKTITPTALGGEYGIIETSVPGGPLTSSIYGPEAIRYYSPPLPVPLYNGENQGIKIEKF